MVIHFKPGSVIVHYLSIGYRTLASYAKALIQIEWLYPYKYKLIFAQKSGKNLFPFAGEGLPRKAIDNENIT